MKTSLTILLAIFSLNSFACRCGGESELKEIIESSKSIFVAKVISKEVVEKNYVSGDRMTLNVKLKVLKKMKGRAQRAYSAVGYEWYPYAEDGTEVVTVGGCHYDIREGDKYLIFYREGEPITLTMCSEYTWRLWEDSEKESIAEVRSTLKRSNKKIQPTPQGSAAELNR